jgi:phage-related holin
MLRLIAEIASGALFTVLWRLTPFRPPNVEPILALAMPMSRTRGAISSAFFAMLSITSFDLLTSGFTQWTVVTSLAYGIVAAGAGVVVSRVRGLWGYMLYAVIGTIVYDFLTGVMAGAVLFGMSWREGFIGQIPFTVNHLIGNVILTLVLSPVAEMLLQRKMYIRNVKYLASERAK